VTDDLIANKIRKRKSRREKIRRKRKIRGRNSRRSSARAVERHSLSVYSGTVWLGNVEQRDNEFTAKTIRGKKIGCFASLAAAANAVSVTSAEDRAR
jgi:hypothetical protein